MGGRVQRFLPTLLASVAIILSVSSASFRTPAPEHRVSDLSLSMQHEAERLRSTGALNAAISYYETALVADPRNADALIGLGDIAREQNLPGKAIGLFRAALAMRPDDRQALAGQGRAYVARGATAQAQRNLTALETLCGASGCLEASQLAAVISHGDLPSSARTALRADQIMPRPVIEAVPLSN